MRVLVVSRFEVERIGVVSTLRRLLPVDAQIEEAMSGPDMVWQAGREPGFDLLVVDSETTGMSCIEALARLGARQTTPKVVVMMDGPSKLRDWMERIPHAWPVDKRRTLIEFINAVETVVSEGGGC